MRTAAAVDEAIQDAESGHLKGVKTDVGLHRIETVA
jgi:hypothetical protein